MKEIKILLIAAGIALLGIAATMGIRVFIWQPPHHELMYSNMAAVVDRYMQASTCSMIIVKGRGMGEVEGTLYCPQLFKEGPRVFNVEAFKPDAYYKLPSGGISYSSYSQFEIKLEKGLMDE